MNKLRFSEKPDIKNKHEDIINIIEDKRKKFTSKLIMHEGASDIEVIFQMLLFIRINWGERRFGQRSCIYVCSEESDRCKPISRVYRSVIPTLTFLVLIT